jgi:hypothetical protein
MSRTRSTNSQPVYFTPAPFEAQVADRLIAGTNAFAPYASPYVKPWSGPPVITEIETSQIIDSIEKSAVTKPVTHTKWKFKYFNVNELEEYVDLGSTQKWRANGPYVHFNSWGWYGGDISPFGGVPAITVSYPKTINTLLLEAKHKFLQPNETDNLLNIVEASQLKSGIGGVFDFLKRVGTAKKVKALDLSNQYLFYSFGVAPLINDMKKVNVGINNLKVDLDRLIRDYNKPITVMARSSGAFALNTAFAPEGYSASQTTGYWHLKHHALSPATRIVGVKGRRSVDYQSDAFKKLHYMVARYVATGPASLAWEKIPYSFVLDWFVNLTGIIDAIDGAITGTSAKIEDSWYSERWSYLADVVHHTRPLYWVTNADGLAVARHEVSYYHRSWVDPTALVGINHRFGKKQASYLSALLHQYVANLRRR